MSARHAVSSRITSSCSCYPPHAGHCQVPACQRQSSWWLAARQRTARAGTGGSPSGAGRASGGSTAAGAFSETSMQAPCSTAVLLSEMLEGLYCTIDNEACDSSVPVSRCRSQAHAVFCEMWEALATAREVTAAPCASNSAAALAIRVSSAARRASARGKRAACELRQAGARRVTTTRPSCRSRRLRCAHACQFSATRKTRCLPPLDDQADVAAGSCGCGCCWGSSSTLGVAGARWLLLTPSATARATQSRPGMATQRGRWVPSASSSE